MLLNIFSCAYWPLVDLRWQSDCSDILPIFMLCILIIKLHTFSFFFFFLTLRYSLMSFDHLIHLHTVTHKGTQHFIFYVQLHSSHMLVK